MIHRIHSGEELTQDFTVYGRNGSVNNYNEVPTPATAATARPATRRQHARTSRWPPGPLDVITQRDYFTPQGPGTAACLGCHDTATRRRTRT